MVFFSEPVVSIVRLRTEQFENLSAKKNGISGSHTEKSSDLPVPEDNANDPQPLKPDKLKSKKKDEADLCSPEVQSSKQQTDNKTYVSNSTETITGVTRITRAMAAKGTLNGTTSTEVNYFINCFI